MTGKIFSNALYQEVAERLRLRIYDQTLQPGQWVDEQALAEQFGISRTPMREALKVLHSEGLVQLKPRRGCYVTELSTQDLDDLYPVMALLEGRCAFEAARRMTAAKLKLLDGLHAKLEKYAAANDIDRYYQSNYAFHGAVEEMAGNPWLTRTATDLRKFLNLYRRRQLQLPGRVMASLAEHRLMIKAFHDLDPKAAEQITHDHLLFHRAALAVLDATSNRKPRLPAKSSRPASKDHSRTESAHVREPV